jgi:hypothetical protein
VPDDPDLLSLRVSTENLNSAIEVLRVRGGPALYPRAYQVLVRERNRRELPWPPGNIVLARGAFEALPPDVQQLLKAGPG